MRNSNVVPADSEGPPVSQLIRLPRHAISIACDDGGGAGLPVLLLHAFPLDRTMWSPQVAALRQAGYRPITVDLPGFGDSPPVPHWSIDTAAGWVADLLDVLGISRTVIGGESMGGYIALGMARHHPAKLAGLVLADTRAGPDDAVARQRRDEMIATIQASGPAAIVDALLPKMVSELTQTQRPEVVRQLRDTMARQKAEGLIPALVALRDRPDATPVLPSIAVPTLVMVGEFDTLTPPLIAARLAGMIPNARLVHIPVAGHISNLENPEAFNAALLEFLKTCSPSLAS